MYVIYHIPNIKIGCTTNYPKRCIAQGYTNYEILEVHEDGWLAGDRERELQQEYGYPVDKGHYMNQVVKHSNYDNVGKNSLSFEIRSKGGKCTRILTFEQAEEIRTKYIPRKYTMNTLAKEYNVQKYVIKCIIQRKTYKEV